MDVWSSIAKMPRSLPVERAVSAIMWLVMDETPGGAAQIDDVDRKLIELLREDGRMSFKELADRADVSADVARFRVLRLLKHRVIRVMGVVHPASLGYAALGTAWASYRGDVKVLAESLGALPYVTYMVESLPPNNVLFEVVGHSVGSMSDALQTIQQMHPQLEFRDFWRTIDYYKWQSQGRSPLMAPATTGEPIATDDEDIALLRVLVTDPRASFNHLAEVTGLPYWNVRRRTQRLFAVGAVRATVMVDRLALGDSVHGIVCIKTVGDVDAALRAVAAIPQVAIVSYHTGEYEASAEVFCQSATELADVARAIAGAPHVTAIEVRLYARTHVVATPWFLEGSVRA